VGFVVSWRSKEAAPTKRTTPRRPVELVGACTDHRGTDGLALALWVAIEGRGMERKTFPHDETVEGLADAWDAAGRWIRAGGK
jgi:hypothetical protein